MLGILEYVIGMLRILANEVEDPEDGEERICTSSVACGDTYCPPPFCPLRGHFPRWGNHPRGGRHAGKEGRA